VVTIDVQAYTACWAVTVICTMDASINVNALYTNRKIWKYSLYMCALPPNGRGPLILLCPKR